MSTRTDCSRRDFLRRIGLGVAVVSGASALPPWSARAGAVPARVGTLGDGRRDRTLVVVELGGGNDGLNTAVPLDVGAYHDLRPTLAVAEPLDVGEAFGFHPSLPGLAQRYRDGQVAVVEGLGYPDPDLSHFGSIAIWWSARGGSGQSGWLGAYLDETVGFDDPLAAIGIGPAPSPALLGRSSFATTISDATGLQPRVPDWLGDADSLLDAWRDTAPRRPDPATLTGQVARAIDLTVEARAELTDALDLDAAGAADVSDDTSPSGTRAYQDRSVVDSLALAAALVRSPARPRVVYVSGIGDFDTHQGQAEQHPALLEQLDTGITGFFDALGGEADRAVVMTTSEFGRRPSENGSGTDHGTANAHLVIGPKVRGGRHGEAPSLTRLDETGNLEHTVDFRSLYATVLGGWLGVEHEPVLGAEHETLELFRA